MSPFHSIINSIGIKGDMIHIVADHTSHLFRLRDLQFDINDECGGAHVYLYREKEKAWICGITWSHISDFLDEHGVTIPMQMTPCYGCDSTKCRMFCQGTIVPRAKEQSKSEVAIA